MLIGSPRYLNSFKKYFVCLCMLEFKMLRNKSESIGFKLGFFFVGGLY